jgi:hypothetical protein
MSKIFDFLKTLIVGKTTKGEKAYTPIMSKFKTTYPPKQLSEDSWKILHKLPIKDE